jgi:hypothetical protein
MKNVTITVADDVYRQARQKAAMHDTSLSRVVTEYLQRWNVDDQQRANRVQALRGLFARAERRDRDKRGSAGPFRREATYAERLR